MGFNSGFKGLSYDDVQRNEVSLHIFLTLKKVNGQLHALTVLSSDKNPPVSNEQKAGWPQG